MNRLRCFVLMTATAAIGFAVKGAAIAQDKKDGKVATESVPIGLQ